MKMNLHCRWQMTPPSTSHTTLQFSNRTTPHITPPHSYIIYTQHATPPLTSYTYPYYCRLINSLSIILQKDLIKSFCHHIYIYMYMYIYSQNYKNTTMHYYAHFYCLITYNLLHVPSARKQVPSAAHTSQWVLTDLSERDWGEHSRCPGIRWLSRWTHTRLYWIKDTV